MSKIDDKHWANVQRELNGLPPIKIRTKDRLVSFWEWWVKELKANSWQGALVLVVILIPLIFGPLVFWMHKHEEARLESEREIAAFIAEEKARFDAWNKNYTAKLRAEEEWRRLNPEKWAEQQRIAKEAEREKYRQEYLKKGNDAVKRHKKLFDRFHTHMLLHDGDNRVLAAQSVSSSYAKKSRWKDIFGYDPPDWALRDNYITNSYWKRFKRTHQYAD